MADEIVGWSIVAKLSVDDSEFRAKLRAAEQSIAQTRQAFASAGAGGMAGGGGGGGGGGLGGFAGPSSQFFSGGGGPPTNGPAAALAGGGGFGGGGIRPTGSAPAPVILRPTAPAAASFPGLGMIGQAKAQGEADIRARAKALKEEEAASKSNRMELGLRAAYMLRAATGGGAAGIAGGGLGALLGHLSGVGAGFGSIVGNQIGQGVGDFARNANAQNEAGVALGAPWMARQRQLAERDAGAARGLAYRGEFAAATRAEQQSRDFYASGGRGPAGIAGGLWSDLSTQFQTSMTGAMARAQGVTIRPGAGAGLAANPLLGQNIGGPEDVWGHAARSMLSQTPPGAFGAGGGGAAVQANTEAVQGLTQAIQTMAPAPGGVSGLHIAGGGPGALFPTMSEARSMASGAGWLIGQIGSFFTPPANPIPGY